MDSGREENKIHSFYWHWVIKPHWMAALTVATLVLFVAFFDLATVGLGVPVLETAMSGAPVENRVVTLTRSALEYFSIQPTKNFVLFVLVILVSLAAVFRGGFALLNQYATASIAQNMHWKIRSKLLRLTMMTPYSYFSDKSRGTILYNLSLPPKSMFQVITYFSQLCQGLMNVLFLIGLMLYLSWWATIGIGVFGLLWVQSWRAFADKRSVRVGRLLYELESSANKVEVDAVDGVKVVKLNTLVDKVGGRQEALLKGLVKPHLKFVMLNHGATFFNEIIAFIIVLTLAGLTFGLEVLAMSFASLVIFFVALRRINPCLSAINGAYAQLNKEKKNVEVVAELLHSLPVEKFGNQKTGEIQSIELQNISFCYPTKKDHWVLDQFSLNLKKGELTALVGSTGSGKSTLANVLAGLYRPLSGEILVNGLSLSDLDLEDWRKKIGFVSQDIFLFNDTIGNNITLWDENISQEKMMAAAQKARLHDYILSLPEAYDTLVGDRGMKLSGGQCQRVAIARAILKHPQILIFDEATSALDNVTEKAVYEAIHSLRKEAIVLVIAHRLTTIQDADQIAVLQAGKVMECGRHEDLIEVGGAYKKLYQGEGEKGIVYA